MKTYSVESNATRAARKAYPNGDFEVYKASNGEWAIRGPKFDAAKKTARHVDDAMAARLATKDIDLHTTFKMAYAFFNDKLFAGRLPECMILIHRKRNARGYFWAEQWKHKTSDEGRHEIAMNPDNFGNRDTKDILSTLVHEMTHLEQQVFGKPSRNSHHNREWVKMMLAVDLLPYDVRRENKPTFVDGVIPDIKYQTGPKVSHVVIPGGAFDKACDELLATGVDITWTTHERSAADKALAKQKRASKTKFTCPDCGQNAWAKPDAHLICGHCGVEMEDEA